MKLPELPEGTTFRNIGTDESGYTTLEVSWYTEVNRTTEILARFVVGPTDGPGTFNFEATSPYSWLFNSGGLFNFNGTVLVKVIEVILAWKGIIK